MLKSYGINEAPVYETNMDYHLEEFRNLGYTIIEDVLSENELVSLRAELDRIYEAQKVAFGREKMKEINEEYTARALLTYSDLYLNLANHPLIKPYVQKVLGDYYVLHLQNGVINMPNESIHQSSWHRDIPYQNWVSSAPMGCNAFYCLDDFNPETGATIVLPYSHKIDHAPSSQYIEKHSVQIRARAGSVIFFDSMLLHKSGYNSSINTIRRGINNLYARAFISQQINLPAMLAGKYSDDASLRTLLGYDTTPPIDVEDYRHRRLHKIKNRK